MQQWTADASAAGLRVNYTGTGSPDGLSKYSGSVIDFAGTEAEFASMGVTDVNRGYQYVPSVAGAVAIMYNLEDRSGRKVDYLHLSRRTIARIFLGEITSWSDPAISQENAGFNFPDQPINVVFRSGQSGTTALFYDFVQHAAPDAYARWAARFRINQNIRILEPPPNFAPKTQGLGGSDQIAQFISSGSGKWSIGYDEFGYAKTYNVPSAWVQNGAGKWVLPYAQNISEALEGARLRPDLSQELSGVYNSANPKAYPLSAYSYIVTPCAPGGRSTCRGGYPDAGVTETMSRWLSYIACDGQVSMARIGYSPLPPNLSQEVANAVGYMSGTPARQLNASNCNNPRFRGSLGAGAESPSDPYEKLEGGVCAASGCQPGGQGGGGTSGPGAGSGGGGGAPGSGGGADPGSAGVSGGDGSTAKNGSSDSSGAAAGDAAGTASESEEDLARASGRAGSGSQSVGGGRGIWRRSEPTQYARKGRGGIPLAPSLVFTGALAVPALYLAKRRRGSKPT